MLSGKSVCCAFKTCLNCKTTIITKRSLNIYTGECAIPLSSIDLASSDPIMKDIKEPPKGDALGELCLALRFKPARYVVNDIVSSL